MGFKYSWVDWFFVRHDLLLALYQTEVETWIH